MNLPQVVTPEEWENARRELLAKEKAHTRAGDALAAERRRLPMVRFDKDYELEAPDGKVSLLDLFEGRRQLIVYHFMLQPGGEPCEGCSMVVDNMGHPAHLNARDVTRVLVSAAPVEEIERVKERMGWSEPWYSVADSDFNADCGIKTAFGLSVFLREGDDVFRTYFTTNRAAEAWGSNWSYLDLTPLGRQEDWEDSPEGYPQNPPYQDWRLHDEYDAQPTAVA